MGKHLMLIFVIPPLGCLHNEEGGDGGSDLGNDFDCLNGNGDGLGLGGLSGLSGLGLGGLSGLSGLGGVSGLGLGGLCSANPLTFWCSSGTFSKTEDLVVGE